MKSTTACNSCFCPRATLAPGGMVCSSCHHGRSAHTKHINTAPLTDSVPAGKRDTSRQAFASIRDQIRGEGQRIVFDEIVKRGGATCEEIVIGESMRTQTVSARINDLHRAGWVVDSGERRKTTSGRNAIVWVVA